MTDIDKGLEDVQKELNTLHLDHKQSLGPYIVIFGQKLYDINTIYVVVGTFRLKCDSLILAVDLCFKIFKALGKKFPKTTAHVWEALEKELYLIDSSLHAGVRDLIVLLSKF